MDRSRTERLDAGAAQRALWARLAVCGAVGGALACALWSCGEPNLQPTPPERVTVIPGMPGVSPETGIVDEVDPGGDTPIRQSRPWRCDTFGAEQRLAAVDVVLVVDTGRSMAPRRDDLLEAFSSFFDGLLAGETASVRVGILEATERGWFRGRGMGRLVRIPGADVPYLTCGRGETGGGCNVGTGTWDEAKGAFLQAIASVESGAGSLGLLSVAELLRGNEQENKGFLRDEAALHVVVVSDADDVSCSERTAGSGPCTSFEGCRCDEASAFGGDVDWFVRLLRGVKGYGYDDRVGLSAWVAVESALLQTAATSRFYEGCSMDPAATCESPSGEGAACALRGSRYGEVARALGGALADICSEPDGLERIGARISGASAAFLLERKPLPSTIETVLLSIPEKSCNHLAPCSEEGQDCIRGRCGQVVLEGGASGWQYVSCSNGIPRNEVRIRASMERWQNQKFEICYDVDVGADPSLCP